MRLKIITPHGTTFDGDVSRIQFPAAMGLMEILENHAPLIAAVRQGNIVLNEDEQHQCGGGVLKVENNNVTIVCE